MVRPEQYVKIVLIGAGGVGKSTIAKRLVSDAVIPTEMTVGMDIQSWVISNENHACFVKVSLFDLGGQSQFRFFQEPLIRGAHIVLLVVDVSDFNTFIELNESWLPMVSTIPRSRWILIGNKVDKLNENDCSDVIELAEKLGIRHVCVSATTGYNFDVLRDEIFKALFAPLQL